MSHCLTLSRELYLTYRADVDHRHAAAEMLVYLASIGAGYRR